MFIELSHAFSLEIGRGRPEQELLHAAEQNITEVDSEPAPAAPSPQRAVLKAGFQPNPDCDCEECR